MDGAVDLLALCGGFTLRLEVGVLSRALFRALAGFPRWSRGLTGALTALLFGRDSLSDAAWAGLIRTGFTNKQAGHTHNSIRVEIAPVVRILSECGSV